MPSALKDLLDRVGSTAVQAFAGAAMAAGVGGDINWTTAAVAAGSAAVLAVMKWAGVAVNAKPGETDVVLTGRADSLARQVASKLK